MFDIVNYEIYQITDQRSNSRDIFKLPRRPHNILSDNLAIYYCITFTMFSQLTVAER